MPAGSVTATGTSTDDKGVTEVRIAVRNRDNNLWLQGDGSWGTAYAYRLATVASPGATLDRLDDQREPPDRRELRVRRPRPGRGGQPRRHRGLATVQRVVARPAARPGLL